MKLALPANLTVTFKTNSLKPNQMNENKHELEIGLYAWIIQDGNYGDFTVG